MGAGHDHHHDHGHAPDRAHDHAHGPPPAKGGIGLILGIILGVFVLGTCGVGVLAALLLPALAKAKDKANRTKCQNNMRQISIGAIMYSDDQRAFPYVEGDVDGRAALTLLLQKGYVDTPECYSCPCAPGGGGYVFFPVPVPANARSTTPIGWEAAPRADGGRNVSFADGTTTFVTGDEFAELEARARKPPSK